MKTAKNNLISILLFIGITFQCFWAGEITVGEAAILANSRALSLRVLQEQLIENQKNGINDQSLRQFAGLNYLAGYVVDETNHDIILIGKVVPSRPALYLEDFVIALRNAGMKYIKIEKDGQYYSTPSCSIDPYPEVMKRLQTAGSKIFDAKSEAAIAQGIDEWDSTCIYPQRVTVFGIPFHTHFAKVMVQADYDMKNLVNGSDSLGIAGFKSLLDLRMDRAYRDIKAGKPISIPLSSYNRFWYYPGVTKFSAGDGIVRLDTCQVILLTEQQYLTSSGQSVSAGYSDPMARQFSQNHTDHYAQIAKLRPIYQELAGLYRHVALVKSLLYQSAPVKAGLNLDFLLDYFDLTWCPVDSTLPGRRNMKELKYTKYFENGSSIFQMWLPSCGGVKIDIDVTTKSYSTIHAAELEAIKSKVLVNRPSLAKLIWDFPVAGKDD
ncbi:MAG TPA: DUF1598 domain-containing protein [Bacteroidetes bacterium]|nr:DUF1598 domain-containing protein [Bacteroidota bacterium]